MKILITAPSLETQHNVSGISSVARQIIEYGSEEFHHFATGRRDGEKAGVRWLFRQLSAVPRLRREIREKKIDIVHLNTALAPLSIVRDAALAKAATRPVLLHLHGGRFYTEGFGGGFWQWLTVKMLRQAVVVVVLSETEKKFVEKLAPNADVRVLQNSVALDEAQPRSSPHRAEKTIIFLGRLHPDKGLREIAEACRSLTRENFRFDFRCFGEGAARESFAREMSEILGEKFFYGGIASSAEKWKELAAADIFLLPSHYEGLPMSLLEAMASGCVPVASAVGSIPSAVKDGVNGFLIEPKNVAQLVEKLKFLLAGKPDWESLRRSARAVVEEKFNLENYIERLENIYAEIIS